MGVHVVVPAGIDDPARPSGGNVYDRRLCNGLAGLGWDVHEHPVDGPWPSVDAGGLDELAGVVSKVPDGAVLVVDGLIASVSAAVLLPAASRLRLVVLVHLPLDVAGEDTVLGAARAVITTSRWSREQLLDRYPLDASTVHVVAPGAACAAAVTGTPDGRNLLCVAPVSPHKGQDVLLTALAEMRDLAWHCRLVGSLAREPEFAEHVRQQAADLALADRVEMCGTRTGAELSRVYATSDLLVHPSHGETYGMVITEALAHALPVVATEVGGVPEALGDTSAGRPGVLVAAGQPLELAAALRTWLTDADTRRRLRCAAAQRRQTLPSWQTTASRAAQVLTAVLP